MKSRILIAAIAVSLTAAPALRAQHDHPGHNHSGTSTGMMKSDMHKEGGEKMGHSHEKSELHQGMVMMTKAHHFEAVYLNDGIRLYAYDAAQGQASIKGMEGRATLMYKSGDPKVVAMLYREGGMVDMGGKKQGPLQDYLVAPVDLTDSTSLPVRVKFSLTNVAGEEGGVVEFMQPFGGVVNAPYACPMHPDVWGTSDKTECPLCGMSTSAPRSDAGKSAASPHVHESSRGHDN